MPANRCQRSVFQLILVLAACRGGSQAGPTPQQPALPLPLAGLSGQTVAVLPVNMLLAEEGLGWDSLLGEHRAALDRADSTIGEALTQRAPEVAWVLPRELRRAARQAPSFAADPDRLATSVLRDGTLTTVPDPLRAQIRTLAALGGGVRFVLAPAAVFFKRPGTVELHMVLVDARTGQVQWRSVPKADAADPWAALRAALRQLTPGLP